jgi:hypothetical protein
VNGDLLYVLLGPLMVCCWVCYGKLPLSLNINSFLAIFKLSHSHSQSYSSVMVDKVLKIAYVFVLTNAAAELLGV